MPQNTPPYAVQAGKTLLFFLICLMGHSLGAEMAYRMALKDPEVKALAFSGFAYTLEATSDNPKNMLVIIGQYDEFRRRMTGVRNIEKEWMFASSQVVAPLPI